MIKFIHTKVIERLVFFANINVALDDWCGREFNTKLRKKRIDPMKFSSNDSLYSALVEDPTTIFCFLEPKERVLTQAKCMHCGIR